MLSRRTIIVLKRTRLPITTLPPGVHTLPVNILIAWRAANTIDLDLLTSTAEPRGGISAETRQEGPIIFAAIIAADLLGRAASIV